jgi:hypothetical protein
MGIDHLRKMVSRAMDFLQIGNELLLTARLGVFLQHFAVTDDLIQRRAQFVAKMRKRVMGSRRGGRSTWLFDRRITHMESRFCNCAAIFSSNRGNSIGLVS